MVLKHIHHLEIKVEVNNKIEKDMKKIKLLVTSNSRYVTFLKASYTINIICMGTDNLRVKIMNHSKMIIKQW